jgi:rRNA maturation protein Nop10
MNHGQRMMICSACQRFTSAATCSVSGFDIAHHVRRAGDCPHPAGSLFAMDYEQRKYHLRCPRCGGDHGIEGCEQDGFDEEAERRRMLAGGCCGRPSKPDAA